MRQRSGSRGEDGSLLLILMVGVAVMSIGVGVAAQSWSSTWRRDNEEELIFRAGQYVEAIRAYQKEHNGQLPTNLPDLMKPGPRQLRYIRKLFRDPVNPTGQWGLLYLMPGGQGIYDPVLAQKQTNSGGSKDGAVVGIPGVTALQFNQGGIPGANQGGQRPNMPPLPRNPGAAGPPGRAGFQGNPGFGMNPGRGAGGGAFNQPGAFGQQQQQVQGGGSGITAGAPAAQPASGEFSDEEPSEPPIGWPIAGVISRAPERFTENTFKIYKGHEKLDEWQFHVFEGGIDQPQTPAGVLPRGPTSVGPGYGGKGLGPISGGNEGPRLRNRQNWPSPNPKQ